MARCPTCRKFFATLPDEANDHQCPRCGPVEDPPHSCRTCGEPCDCQHYLALGCGTCEACRREERAEAARDERDLPYVSGDWPERPHEL